MTATGEKRIAVFGWFRKRVTTGIPTLPDTVRWYMDALEPHLTETLVKNHFHQVTWFNLLQSDGKTMDFYALEFLTTTAQAVTGSISPDNAGNRAALIWAVGTRNWYVDRCIPVAQRGADITCAPSSFTSSYCADRATLKSLDEGFSIYRGSHASTFLRSDSG